jgi:hypothetical protein
LENILAEVVLRLLLEIGEYFLRGSNWTSPSIVNIIDYITISTTGNSSDFGDLTWKRGNSGGCSNA